MSGLSSAPNCDKTFKTAELPHHLIESFKATLEEVQEADLLLHVLDVSHPNFKNFNEAVLNVLSQLGAEDKPLITVLNKIDRVDDQGFLNSVEAGFDNAVSISALGGQNTDQLIEKISAALSENLQNIDVEIPIDRMDLVNLAHQKGQVHSVDYSSASVHIIASVPPQVAQKLRAA